MFRVDLRFPGVVTLHQVDSTRGNVCLVRCHTFLAGLFSLRIPDVHMDFQNGVERFTRAPVMQ